MIVYVDMDNTLFQYREAYDRYKLEHPDVAFPQSIEGFFRDLVPKPDAIETMQWLASQPDVDLYILTAPSVYNPHCYTEKRLSIEKHLGFDWCHRLIISPNKGLLKGRYLVDDEVEGRGQESFEGTVIQFGSPEYPDWSHVKAKFQRILRNGANF